MTSSNTGPVNDPSQKGPLSAYQQQAAAPSKTTPKVPLSASSLTIWKNFLGPGATDEDVEKLFNNLLSMLNSQIQSDQQKAKQASDEMKQAIEGN